MGRSKALGIIMGEYGWKKVIGVLCLIAALYTIGGMVISNYKKEKSAEELKKSNKEEAIALVILIVAGVVLLLLP